MDLDPPTEEDEKPRPLDDASPVSVTQSGIMEFHWFFKINIAISRFVKIKT